MFGSGSSHCFIKLFLLSRKLLLFFFTHVGTEEERNQMISVKDMDL